MTFDRLAPFYRAMEFFTAGGKLQRRRLAFVDEIPVPHRILLAGEGHGRSLPVFVERFPEANIVVMDSSMKMLEIARGKVSSERMEFVHADLLTWDGGSGNFDLIVTNFFLDCFPADQLTHVVSRLGKWSSPDAHWLLADFNVAQGKLAGLRSRVILAMLYTFFRIVCVLEARNLVSPDADLQKSGFSLHRRELSEWGLLKSEWWRRECP